MVKEFPEHPLGARHLTATLPLDPCGESINISPFADAGMEALSGYLESSRPHRSSLDLNLVLLKPKPLYFSGYHMVCPCFGAFYSTKVVTLLWKRSDRATHLPPSGDFLEQLVVLRFLFFVFVFLFTNSVQPRVLQEANFQPLSPLKPGRAGMGASEPAGWLWKRRGLSELACV